METLVVDNCNLKSDPGFCQLAIERYFYNSTSSQCETFTYNGCGGNENRFESRDECIEACIPPPPPEEIGDDISEDNADNADDDNDDDTNEGRGYPTADRTLFGQLFRKRLFPRPMFNPWSTFNPFGSNENTEQDREEQEEQEEDGDLSFSSIFDSLRPRIRPIFNPFGKPFRRNPFTSFGKPRHSFGRIFSKTMKSFGKDFDKSFQTVSRRISGSLENLRGLKQDNDMKCAVCKRVVKIVEYDLRVLNMSVQAILKLSSFICDFFPTAKKTCDVVIADLKAIIRYIGKGLSPENVCEKVQLCNSTLPEGVTKTVSISFSRNCSPLCNFMKAVQGEKMTKMAESWNSAKSKLKTFCHDNKILKKCDLFYTMFEKSLQHLSNITEQKDGESCKCFSRQPLFETKKFDSCLRCKQFEKGMFNELQEVNRSILLLASRIQDMCPLFQGKVCKGIVKELTNSLNENNAVSMPNVCNVTGYCQNKEKENIFGRVKDLFTGIFPDTIRPRIGMGLRLKKFSPTCMFCKKCMGELKETFKSINGTVTDAKSVYPSVKEGFGLYCETKSVGGEYATVCKKISDGMEAVHKVITKRGNNEEGMCKTLGVC